MSRTSAAVLDEAAFDRVVRDGSLTQAGRPAFSELTDAKLEALRHSIRQQAEAALP